MIGIKIPFTGAHINSSKTYSVDNNHITRCSLEGHALSLIDGFDDDINPLEQTEILAMSQNLEMIYPVFTGSNVFVNTTKHKTFETDNNKEIPEFYGDKILAPIPLNVKNNRVFTKKKKMLRKKRNYIHYYSSDDHCRRDHRSYFIKQVQFAHAQTKSMSNIEKSCLSDQLNRFLTEDQRTLFRNNISRPGNFAKVLPMTIFLRWATHVYLTLDSSIDDLNGMYPAACIYLVFASNRVFRNSQQGGSSSNPSMQYYLIDILFKLQHTYDKECMHCLLSTAILRYALRGPDTNARSISKSAKPGNCTLWSNILLQNANVDIVCFNNPNRSEILFA